MAERPEHYKRMPDGAVCRCPYSWTKADRTRWCCSGHGTEAPAPDLSYQSRVHAWMLACFTVEIAKDATERNHRFLEEALELVQSLGCTASEAHQLVDYVFGRPDGDVNQEMGGVMVTLAALANCHDIDMIEAGETELARCWKNLEKIRAKQATKPKHSPLPAMPVGVPHQPQEQST
jgi:NTP pyrophosphatase (non-canonical NTP hydrolase)